MALPHAAGNERGLVQNDSNPDSAKSPTVGQSMNRTAMGFFGSEAGLLGKEHSGGSGGASRTGTRSARRRRGTSSAFRSPSAVSARGAAPGYANAPSATLAAYPWICAARRRLSRAEAARIRRVSDSGLKLQRLAARLACFRPERVLVPATNAYRHQDGLWFLSPAQTAVYTIVTTSHRQPSPFLLSR